MLPDVQFVGVESKRKKVDAVNLIASELGLDNVHLVHSRLEDFLFDRPAVITFKAVGTVKDYLPAIKRTTSDLSVFFYKGPSFMELESKDLPSLEQEWKMMANLTISVPGTQQRSLVSFACRNVPRGTPKTLVKLSDFL
jgi:16S rRNA G527 N7-methylase RsmG